MPTGFVQQFPMLAGDATDLGFENLGLPRPEFQALLAAWVRDGVRVPDSPYKLRQDDGLIVESHTGAEPMLPEHWLRGAWVQRRGVYLWIGASVRIGNQMGDQIPGQFDFTPYTRLADGWMLTAAIS
jgi:hypothetical protein